VPVDVRFLTAVAAVAVVAVVPGCGGKSSTTTSASAVESWASGVCTAFATWKSAVNGAVSSVRSHPTKDTMQQGLTTAQTATSTLTKTLKDLGMPSTASGQAARSTLNTLEDQLQHGVSQIKDAAAGVKTSGDVISAMATASGTITTMRAQLDAARSTLASLPAGELHDAFATVPACEPFRSKK